MGWNEKMSIRGRLFMRKVKPFTKIIGWGTFLFAIIWSIIHDYSFLKGISFVVGFQFTSIILYGVFLYVLLRYKEKQWRKELA